MRWLPLLLTALLVACEQQPTEDLADTLAADPVRLRALRAQCADHRQMVGEDACLAAAEAFLRRFLAGESGPDELRTVADLPLIPPSFNTPVDDVEDAP
ncbi:hypothetical protein [Pseudomonas lopnurensis]|uniref:hypothetical protein n=1 Tax=Pseudomonas lopnurensis TaxID=1477517 RepID=UPI0028A73E37|nr:hypothetical protein [Pseudomonas lopnurensis]